MFKGVGVQVSQGWGRTLSFVAVVLAVMPACSADGGGDEEGPDGAVIGDGDAAQTGGSGGTAAGGSGGGNAGGNAGLDAGLGGDAEDPSIPDDDEEEPPLPPVGGNQDALPGSGVVGGMGGTSPDAGMPGSGGTGGTTPPGVVTPVPPSENFLFSSDFSGKRATDVPPWKRISFQHPGVKLRGWTRSPKTEATGTGAREFDFQSQAAVGAATLEEAITAERYAAVAFEPASPGLVLDLNGATVTFAVNRQTSAGAGSIAVLSSVGGFTADKVLFVGTAGVGAPDPVDLYTFTLPGAGFGNIAGAVEFRLYAVGTAGTKAPTAIRAFWIGGNVVNAALNRTPKRRDYGTNLGEVKEYGTDSPFLDKFKLARPWFTSKSNDSTKAYETNFSKMIPRDANGWPKKVPFTVPGFDDARYVHTIIRLPYNGKWALMYKGSGTIRLSGAISHTVKATGGDGRTDILINKSDIGYGTVPEVKFIAPAILYMDILESSESDPIKDIRVVHHGHLATYESQVFEPAFLARLHGFSPIRFLKWSNTNHNYDSTWQDRTTPGYYTQAEDDVAWEYIIALLNATKSDGWITVPHLATDDYLTRLATMFRDTLDPNLKLYVELSNETWHNGYPSGKWVTEQEKNSPLNREEFATRQQVRVWEVFQDVYGSSFETRIRRPMGGWAAVDSVNRARLTALNNAAINPRGIKAQGLALAPYFGKVYRKDVLDAGVPSVEKLLDDAAEDLAARRARHFVDMKQTAKDFNVELWANEGGQTIRPDGEPAREVADFITNMTLANRHERMGTLYRSYMDVLNEAGFTLFLHFTFVEASGKFGAWGSLENLDQPSAQAPKHRALEEAIFGP